MRKLLMLLALFFCFLLPAGNMADGITAAIKESVKAHGLQLTLGDIAEMPDGLRN